MQEEAPYVGRRGTVTYGAGSAGSGSTLEPQPAEAIDGLIKQPSIGRRLSASPPVPPQTSTAPPRGPRRQFGQQQGRSGQTVSRRTKPSPETSRRP
ncbi:hypothetical protein GCM10010145_09070 [Streptomyces ruber]|uniref:Uncharacterized protein n=2 Tax=Streptomyces TaxID=1883 RepID=A0A918EPK7_9ACTN|nr:hypothetical protein GCM10010145_09070 [Streptomyces ruber]